MSLIGKEYSTGPVTTPDEIDAVLVAAGSEVLPLKYLEPQNANQEQARFMEDPGYQPQFTYGPLSPEDYRRLLESLLRVEPERNKLGALFLVVREYLLQRLRLRYRIGQEDFWGRNLYGEPSDTLVSLAGMILKARQPEEPPDPGVYSAEQLRDLALATFEEYGLERWEVRIRDNISSVNVESVNRLLNLRGDQTYSATMMRRLIVHEVETHVFRAENGYAQPYRILAVGAIPGYLATEEGLAVVNEERLGYVDHARMRIFAGRVLAARAALKRSFREVYTEMRDLGFDAATAFNVTKRVKRGLGNTALPGGYVKDHLYLEGKLLLEEYVVGGGDLRALYAGKIGLSQLEYLDPAWVKPPIYLPRSYGLPRII